MFDIVGIDYPCVDLNVNVDELPGSNGVTLINNLSWQGGGKVASGLTAAARLGAKCAILGAPLPERWAMISTEAFAEKTSQTMGLTLRFLKHGWERERRWILF